MLPYDNSAMIYEEGETEMKSYRIVKNGKVAHTFPAYDNHVAEQKAIQLGWRIEEIQVLENGTWIWIK